MCRITNNVNMSPSYGGAAVSTLLYMSEFCNSEILASSLEKVSETFKLVMSRRYCTKQK